MNDNMYFRLARREEAEEILKLYKSLIGMEYCAWTENYPTEQEVEFDLSRDALFSLWAPEGESAEPEQTGVKKAKTQQTKTEQAEDVQEKAENRSDQKTYQQGSREQHLVGVISIDDDPQVKSLSCWSTELMPVAELSRLGVAAKYQNRGIARRLLCEAMEVLKQRGYKAVHILVAKDNVKALRSYEKLHFTLAGECNLYDHAYWCYEKAL